MQQMQQMQQLKKILKQFVSQEFINNFYHLPKAILANIYYGFPAGGIKVIGVTGTDGKTTTANMIYQILKAAGKKVSMVSTINVEIAGKSYETGFHVTSPNPFAIQRFAKAAKDNGDQYLVLEVTSHSLDQYRFWGIKFEVGVITNVTHEHLDYHKTFENYFNTKLKLIHDAKVAVVNGRVREVKGIRGKALTFGLNKGDFNQREVKLKLKIPGDYNIENALAALTVAFVLNIKKEIAKKALEKFTGLKGRMEEIKNSKGIKIFIDFAHTPNGLKQALIALKSQKKGRIIALIGAEGFRDEGKRAMMGEVAQKMADIVIVTAVDPRGLIEIINAQISQGAKKAGAKENKNFFIINDRQKAIGFAINNLAKKGDTVGIFGKGHETSMNIDGKREIPWSDAEVVRWIISTS
ncbi:hypothetical protein A3C26_01475 [Candidatus Daviesbacteria bacterium RIFCSPHIGHO2_02_FULL_39_12]|uniref:UDP-N-acetylmuramoyl-L-alanyl-D-glutamate--2, 6-diaminopimelate ligase n=2 Tax=Candidatus Daviesiibacteriota TaxID=1752718 RepID=A0A1F5JC00_9BACT|nr:MAG: hypothetical protein A3C26_01475 [Candidatus Daviesbacteria bacterium RIFCSPHIGHO2_02_FULL_39_12]OGE72030.1 MAG: hypothetical protein A3H40_00625 [Candidatus Daviesbacteria bacterium RIFCSPLOWO2_02_FULL_38_15]